MHGSAGSNGWVFRGACLVGVALIVGAYANSFHNSFHFDDSHVVEQNLYVRSLSNIPLFFRDATTFSSLPANAVYRPLVTTSLALDYWMGGGLEVRQFHISQLTMLIVLGVMLFFFFNRILGDIEAAGWVSYAALLAAVLFCVHTANTQTVNYISSRSELLSAMGVVGSFLVYLYVPRSRRVHLYLLPMMIGALAKVPAVVFAPLFFVYLALFEQRLSVADLASSRSWPALRAVTWKSLPAFVVGVALFLWVEAMNAPTAVYGGADRWAYLRTQLFVWLYYGRLFFLPTGLSADTDWGVIPHWLDLRVIVGLLFVCALLGVFWVCSNSRTWRPVAFGIAWFGIALLPASSIFPLAEVTNDHRFFLPFIGFSLAMVWGLAALAARWAAKRPQHRRAIGLASAVVAILVVAGHAVGTYERNKVWRTEETLWRDVVEKSPANGRGWMNYGLTQMSKGRYAEAKRLFDRAKVYTPNYGVLEINLGIVTERLGDPVAAERHFERALELMPGYPGSHHFYGRWLVDRGRAVEAIPHLRRAIALSPALSDSRDLLMNLYYAVGAQAELEALVRETLTVSPEQPVATAYASGTIPIGVDEVSAQKYFRRGLAFTGQGRHLDAALTYRQALKLDPASADAQNNLGWSLAKLGLFQEAIPAFEAALRLRPDYKLARNNLHWAKTQAAVQKPLPATQ